MTLNFFTIWMISNILCILFTLYVVHDIVKYTKSKLKLKFEGFGLNKHSLKFYLSIIGIALILCIPVINLCLTAYLGRTYIRTRNDTVRMTKKMIDENKNIIK